MNEPMIPSRVRLPADVELEDKLAFGLTARQLLDSVRRIAMEVPLAGLDVVEVSPPYDHAEVTAFLANRVVLEALSGVAWRGRARSTATTAPDPAWPLLDARRASGGRVSRQGR